MLRIALAFSSGIICQHQWPELFTHLIGPLVIGLSLCLVLNRYLAYRLQLVLSGILLVTFWMVLWRIKIALVKKVLFVQEIFSV